MRAWHIIDDTKEYRCEFVSVNTFINRLWLKLNNKAFYIEFSDKKDYEYAKRGEVINGLARRGKNMKSIKFVLK